MVDKFGVPLVVGDPVIYTTGSQGNMWLEEGTIIEIDENYYGRYPTKAAALIRASSGRKATNHRSSDMLVSVNPIKNSHPELFI